MLPPRLMCTTVIASPSIAFRTRRILATSRGNLVADCGPPGDAADCRRGPGGTPGADRAWPRLQGRGVVCAERERVSVARSPGAREVLRLRGRLGLPAGGDQHPGAPARR